MKHTIAQQFGLEMVATGLFFEELLRNGTVYRVGAIATLRPCSTSMNPSQENALPPYGITQAPFPPQNTKVTAIRGDQRSSDSATEVPLVNQECSPRPLARRPKPPNRCPEQNCSPANATEKTQDLADRTFRPK